MKKNLREEAKKLAARPYSLKILVDRSESEEPLYLALNPELEGCMAQGLTSQAAIDALDEFRVEYIEHLLTHNLHVPEPASLATVTAGTSDPSFIGATFNLEMRQVHSSFERMVEQAIQPQDREVVVEASLKI